MLMNLSYTLAGALSRTKDSIFVVPYNCQRVLVIASLAVRVGVFCTEACICYI
jgi:hypothetical protein